MEHRPSPNRESTHRPWTRPTLRRLGAAETANNCACANDGMMNMDVMPTCHHCCGSQY
jgi:hypothetical protein